MEYRWYVRCLRLHRTLSQWLLRGYRLICVFDRNLYFYARARQIHPNMTFTYCLALVLNRARVQNDTLSTKPTRNTTTGGCVSRHKPLYPFHFKSTVSVVYLCWHKGEPGSHATKETKEIVMFIWQTTINHNLWF